jgi:hypothetical protein
MFEQLGVVEGRGPESNLLHHATGRTLQWASSSCVTTCIHQQCALGTILLSITLVIPSRRSRDG